MDYKTMTSPCGLDCFNCPLYIASTNDDFRKKVTEKTGIPFEMAQCKGCHNEKGFIRAIGKTEPCATYECIKKKKINFCFECSDFPCNNLHPLLPKTVDYEPNNIKVFNLCLIKKMGLEKWAKESSKQVRDTYFKGK
jgi:hypothetical protein